MTVLFEAILALHVVNYYKLSKLLGAKRYVCPPPPPPRIDASVLIRLTNLASCMFQNFYKYILCNLKLPCLPDQRKVK